MVEIKHGKMSGTKNMITPQEKEKATSEWKKAIAEIRQGVGDRKDQANRIARSIISLCGVECENCGKVTITDLAVFRGNGYYCEECNKIITDEMLDAAGAFSAGFPFQAPIKED